MAATVGILKQNLLELYNDQFTDPTPDQLLRLVNLADMDDNVVPTSPGGFVAQQLF